MSYGIMFNNQNSRIVLDGSFDPYVYDVANAFSINRYWSSGDNSRFKYLPPSGEFFGIVIPKSVNIRYITFTGVFSEMFRFTQPYPSFIETWQVTYISAAEANANASMTLVPVRKASKVLLPPGGYGMQVYGPDGLPLWSSEHRFASHNLKYGFQKNTDSFSVASVPNRWIISPYVVLSATGSGNRQHGFQINGDAVSMYVRGGISDVTWLTYGADTLD